MGLARGAQAESERLATDAEGALRTAGRLWSPPPPSFAPWRSPLQGRRASVACPRMGLEFRG